MYNILNYRINFLKATMGFPYTTLIDESNL